MKLIVTVLVVLHITMQTSSKEVCSNEPADLAFLIDESGSVGQSNFGITKDFVAQIVNFFAISETQLKISVFAFSDSVDTTDGFYFNQHSTKQSVVSAITSIAYSNGGTNFEIPLRFAKDNIFNKTNGMRDFALKILVFITDGNASLGSQPGNDLREMGVIVYAVGVGSGTVTAVLKLIATNTSYIFQVANFDVISEVEGTLRTKACEDILSNPCERDPKPCKNGAVCSVRGGAKYNCLCMDGYTGHNCEIDIDDCEGIICYNGGTCIDGLNRFTCNCPDQFTGTHCEIDPCKDNPCLNGGTCLARGWTNFECICPSTFGGTTCKIDLCKPHPSDVVFVIDSSKSMGHHFFAMQKQFIKDLTRNWTIKEEYFQVAIVSFSSTAQIEYDFGSITDVQDLKNKIAMLQFLDKSSRIDVGVAAGEQLLGQQTRQVDYINVKKIMIVITDGLTSSPRDIKPVSRGDITTFVVALGEDISHYYLRKIVGTMANVLPPKPESLLNVLLSMLIHPVCNVCHSSNETDLIIMVDVSRGMEYDDITTHVPSITNKLLSKMGVNFSSTRISLVTFDSDISMRFMFRKYTSTTQYRMQQEMSAFDQSDHKVQNFTEILYRVNDLLFDIESRALKSAKKMILIISNFRFKINDNTTEDIAKSLHNLTEVFTIGLEPGEESFSNMLRLTSSSFHVGTVGNMFANLIDTFISAFVEQLSYVKCSL